MGQAKLTTEIILGARQRIVSGESDYDTEARNAGVSYGTMWGAVKGTHWKHLADPEFVKPRSRRWPTGASKLTAEMVLEARDRYRKGGVTQKELTAEFSLRIGISVDQSTLSDAIAGRSWKHLQNA